MSKPLPKRMAFVYVPNGANMSDWTPRGVGADFELPYILEPLKGHQRDLLVLSGLAHDKGRPHGDGAGDHARASATFLTGCKARKTPGADIKVGVSVDQIAAQRIGDETRLPSLELGTDKARLAGNCDSGYSCAYSFNISWKAESTPMPPEVDPRQVFDRLFGNGNSGEMEEVRIKRDRYRKSILDFALEDARKLRSDLGYTDRRKLDEYLTAVRELEQRIERANSFALALPDYDRPSGVPKSYEEQLKLMFDLLVLAFQTDTTRISTFILAHDGSNRQYPFVGVREGHHDLSHHGGDEEKKAKIARINRFHITQFAYFLDKLKGVKEGEGTLLDNCMIVYGSGLGDGNRHNHDDLPVLLAGKAGGTIRTGRHVRLESETPMANLFLSMLDRVGASMERIGDSTGMLPQLL
ncbi:MAG TPA: DUF1552 domain-containing protein [Candidatus Binatia bacterium]|nr:DUF1552 domain-containing protein [Candidatus Binatia bacterium]